MKQRFRNSECQGAKILMKQITFLVFAFCLFSACKKDRGLGTASVVGHWDWVRSTSWGFVVTPQFLGKNWELTFNPDNTCLQTGTLLPVKSGSYSSPADSLLINFTGDSITARFRYRFISKDSLELDAGSPADGSMHVFIRK